MALLGLCLVLAAAGTGAPPTFVAGERFTLAWTHSIEKVRWEEDYVVKPGATVGDAPVLYAMAARVRGSAAGMEPPPDAVLRDGWYTYTPTQRSPSQLPLMRSTYTADFDLCTPDGCHPMSAWLKSDGGVTLLRPCLGTAPR
ncbi:DUF1850 domain-containing protein [Hydrogenophaga sp. BPS33]|uniref:DUF1850 domain-containing protein n=1 Tax=Hydrogenophaga sp. BPS33 TaxID=2651974 RepID=UPI0013200EDC|nr:DUF1850 domain-containing protein [Hydrogenophaga sp. BPS33]QHE87041.1 DUF1850 domain-containing protein [Hydrogenophaga sp. BPS33]